MKEKRELEVQTHTHTQNNQQSEAKLSQMVEKVCRKARSTTLL